MYNVNIGAWDARFNDIGINIIIILSDKKQNYITTCGYTFIIIEKRSTEFDQKCKWTDMYGK